MKLPPTISDQLRAAIAASDLSRYEIAKRAGVANPVVYKFANGDGDINLSVAGKLAAVLGMHLAPADPTAAKILLTCRRPGP
ncbi:MAG: hypothetical protein A3E01_02880 [Gammaproteobacteria bacterium RIFCSPHIGHO2_12_FULL_63_22]|nr:MAG: hypothetical protein A3E01_02880 [Gammaproteobacteria bacterium RIFCSPHIGHO2_12_FULL_63_22]